jgi:hypothetical protein
MQSTLLADPLAGAEIRDTGGLRKLRWRIPGHGTRGGVRIIYAPLIRSARILLVLVYHKNEQEDLTPEQKRAVRAMLEHEIARHENKQ